MKKEFAGFDDFIPIFQGGKQIDSQGIEHDGDELIDQAIASFDASQHEPPITVGHPKDNSPAFGWVESIRKGIQTLKDGKAVNVLMAKFKDVVPEFASAVQQGLYKKRSASFYPDGRLRHVGFLGGMPPAVKGLADLKFGEADGAIEFEEPIEFMVGGWGLSRIANIFRNLRDWMIEKSGMEEADKIIPSWDIDSIKEEADQLGQIELPQTAETPLFSEKEGDGMPKTFTEDELQAQLKAERDRVTAEKDAEFAEQKKIASGGRKTYTEEDLRAQVDAEKERLTAEFAEKEQKANAALEAAKAQEASQAKALEDAKKAGREEASALFAEKEKQMRGDAHKKEIAEFISTGINSGKILPAWSKMGLAQFMESLPSEQEQAIEFGEGDAKVSKTPYGFMREFLAELPKTVNFEEFATRGKNVGGAGNAGTQLNDLTSKKLKDNPGMVWNAAFSEVQREHPDLTREYVQEIKTAN